MHTGYRPDTATQRSSESTGRLREVFSLNRVSGPITTKNADSFHPPRRNQKRSNFCVRFGMCRALEHAESRIGKPYVPYSPLFLGWHDAMQGDQGANVGTQIYLSAQAAHAVGVCSDDLHPWEIQPHDYLSRMRTRPDSEMYAEAERHQVVESFRLTDGVLETMLSALEGGFGFVYGMPLRQSFFDSTQGDGGVVNNSGGVIVGYHAMYAIDARVVNGKQFIVVDGSWGEKEHYLVPAGVFGTAEFRDLRVVVRTEETR